MLTGDPWRVAIRRTTKRRYRCRYAPETGLRMIGTPVDGIIRFLRWSCVIGLRRLVTSSNWTGARGRNRTGTGLPPTDFKSVASTYSATRAWGVRSLEDGGWDRNRTDVHGFAGRCITTLPPSLYNYLINQSIIATY